MKNKKPSNKKYNKFAQKGLSPLQRKALREYYSYEQIWDIKEISKKITDFIKETHGLDPQDDDNHYSSSRSMRVCEYALGLLGFEKITDTTSVRAGRSYTDKPDRHQTWCHKKGVLVSLDTFCGLQANGDYRVNSLSADTQVDIGSAFQLNFPMTRLGPSASSSFSSLPQGKSASITSYSGDDIWGFLNYLDARQRAGVFLPFEEWVLASAHVSFQPEELINDIEGVISPSSPLSEGEQLAEAFMEALEKLKKEVLPHFPKGLEAVFEEGVRISRLYNKCFEGVSKEGFQERLKEFDWRSCEESLNCYDSLASYSLKRYESDHDRFFVKQWHEALAERSDANFAPATKNHITENGYSWLLCCGARLSHRSQNPNDTIAPLLLKAIEEIDFKVLRQLCETPNATGMTLLVHFFHMATNNKSFTPPSERPINEMLESIVCTVKKRYEEENVPLPVVGNEQATLGGVWLKNVCDFSKRRSYYPPASYEIYNTWKNVFKNQGFEVKEGWNVVLPFDYTEKNYRTYVTPLKQISSPHIGDAFDILTEGVDPEQKVQQDFVFKAILTDVLKDTIQDKTNHRPKKM